MGSGAFLVEACRQLGDALVAAWHAHGVKVTIPPDEDEVLHARRLVAQRCLYGVDKNPMAVDLAKLSLWLATLAKDHPFTFLDHALRCGDSLVGLGREQIRRFHWKPGVKQMLAGQEIIEERLRAAMQYRQQILEAGDEESPLLKQQKLALSDESLALPRFTGNLVVAAFFAEGNDRRRQERRDGLLGRLTEYLRTGNVNLRPTEAEKALLAGPKGILPFHWEIEFPEVFGRANGGFDVIIGNPPFMGGSRISSAYGSCYIDWLLEVHPESHGNGDLVAHFFRRAFSLIRSQGTFGLIATKTIAQGDTRTTGLRWICANKGAIYSAHRRYKWPGQAAVVVSVIHVFKGTHLQVPCESEGRTVPFITAYLFHVGGHDDPDRLGENVGRAYSGVKIYGMGFTFDDTDTKGIASPLRAMEEVVQRDPRNKDRIFPYVGGEEFNENPRHTFHRYVINLEEMDEVEARRWPDLLAILETRVKPERIRVKADSCREFWWRYERGRPELTQLLKRMDRVLAGSNVSAHFGLAFLPTDWIYANTLNLFAFETYAAFCAMQTRVHEIWARFFASSLEDRLRYTPSDCFETFPLPEGFETDPKLEAAGKEYYEFRATLMVKNEEGLTKTYNRFHDPNETSPDILKLRELHAAMDRAVLDAYGWTDLKPTCEFLLDYEEDEDEEDTGGSRLSARRKKKPWRYRWPDDFRDEVLARLLELNKQRAEAERLSGAAAEAKEKKAAMRGKRKSAQADQKELPSAEDH
jgi:hypothetical protein